MSNIKIEAQSIFWWLIGLWNHWWHMRWNPLQDWFIDYDYRLSLYDVRHLFKSNREYLLGGRFKKEHFITVDDLLKSLSRRELPRNKWV